MVATTVPMRDINQKNFMKKSSTHVTNLNSALKNIKLEVTVDFVCSDISGIIVVTNRVANSSDLQTIEHYVKDANYINSNEVDLPRLSQSKSYLKIIGLLYLQEDFTNSLNLNVVKKFTKDNHIFNNTMLASKSHIIKVSPKSDIEIVWIDIWDMQSRSNAKMLINRCFNMSNYIATIHGANMNSGVSQYKNCWRWGHLTFSCHIQETKCI